MMPLEALFWPRPLYPIILFTQWSTLLKGAKTEIETNGIRSRLMTRTNEATWPMIQDVQVKGFQQR